MHQACDTPQDDHTRFVMLIIDEMKIKGKLNMKKHNNVDCTVSCVLEELVFQASSSKLVGFVGGDGGKKNELASNVLGVYAKGK